jgi:hypothetical protein
VHVLANPIRQDGGEVKVEDCRADLSRLKSQGPTAKIAASSIAPPPSPERPGPTSSSTRRDATRLVAREAPLDQTRFVLSPERLGDRSARERA